MSSNDPPLSIDTIHVDALQSITFYLTGQDITRLWLAGCKKLQEKMANGGVITFKAAIPAQKTPVHLPTILRGFNSLQNLSLSSIPIHGIYGRLIIPDWSHLPRHLLRLELDFHEAWINLFEPSDGPEISDTPRYADLNHYFPDMVGLGIGNGDLITRHVNAELASKIPRKMQRLLLGSATMHMRDMVHLPQTLEVLSIALIDDSPAETTSTSQPTFPPLIGCLTLNSMPSSCPLTSLPTSLTHFHQDDDCYQIPIELVHLLPRTLDFLSTSFAVLGDDEAAWKLQLSNLQHLPSSLTSMDISLHGKLLRYGSQWLPLVNEKILPRKLDDLCQKVQLPLQAVNSHFTHLKRLVKSFATILDFLKIPKTLNTLHMLFDQVSNDQAESDPIVDYEAAFKDYTLPSSLTSLTIGGVNNVILPTALSSAIATSPNLLLLGLSVMVSGLTDSFPPNLTNLSLSRSYSFNPTSIPLPTTLKCLKFNYGGEEQIREESFKCFQKLVNLTELQATFSHAQDPCFFGYLGPTLRSLKLAGITHVRDQHILTLPPSITELIIAVTGGSYVTLPVLFKLRNLQTVRIPLSDENSSLQNLDGLDVPPCLTSLQSRFGNFAPFRAYLDRKLLKIRASHEH